MLDLRELERRITEASAREDWQEVAELLNIGLAITEMTLETNSARTDAVYRLTEARRTLRRLQQAYFVDVLNPDPD